jgi:hypothetical protein
MLRFIGMLKSAKSGAVNPSAHARRNERSFRLEAVGLAATRRGSLVRLSATSRRELKQCARPMLAGERSMMTAGVSKLSFKLNLPPETTYDIGLAARDWAMSLQASEPTVMTQNGSRRSYFQRQPNFLVVSQHAKRFFCDLF